MRQVRMLSLVLLLALPAHADPALLDGALGRWLDDEAAPKIAELLGSHPRFKGETVTFAPMRNGQLLPADDRLTWAVEQRLTQKLLRHGGVRLAWRRELAHCAPPQDIPYLIGLEFVPHGAHGHRLIIAMVDVREGIWVSGFSLDWTGRLSGPERAALGVKVEAAPEGTVGNPVPIDDIARIGELMVTRMDCVLPRGLDGPMYVETPSDVRMASITGAIVQRMTLTTIATLTVKRAHAAWVLALESRAMPAGTREFVLTLRDNRDERAAVQQLTSVIVSENGLSVASAPEHVSGNVSSVEPPPTSAGLLSDLSVYQAELAGICRRNSDPRSTCVELGFELLRPAYLIVVSTRNGRMHSQVCGAGLRLSVPGERRYRLRVQTSVDADIGPDAGLYVLAVEKRNVAYRISRLVNQVPGACDGGGTVRPSTNWLSDLKDLLQLHELDVDWRVAHLAYTSTGVILI